METTPPVVEQAVVEKIEEAAEVVDQLSAYGSLIINSLIVVLIGMITVFLLHKLTSKYLYHHIKKPRLLRVVFGTLYVLILVVTMLMVLNRLGIDTTVIGKIALMTVLIGAVIVFFLLPFIPRIPFLIGQMIEVNGVFGTVVRITYTHTSIRTFDGAMVFVPNPVVLASKIINYSDLPERRIALNLIVNLDADIEKVRTLLLKIMSGDDRVVKEPAAPLVRVATASANGLELTALCWVKNDDFLNTQSDLWILLVTAFNDDERVTMSRPQQEIFIADSKVDKVG